LCFLKNILTIKAYNLGCRLKIGPVQQRPIYVLEGLY